MFPALTVALALTTGVLVLAAGLARLGFVANFISEPVLKGFIVGLALTIIVGQVPKLLGVSKGEGGLLRAAVAPDRRDRPEQAAHPGRPGRRARPGPGTGRVHRRPARRPVRQITGHDGYTIRQAAYDLRKLRGKQLVAKPGRTRRYHVPPDGARVIAALLALRDHVIAPILAGIRSPSWAASPRSGPPSTVTTRTSASACRPCSSTSASTRSPQPRRQHLSMR
jgi:Sulfate permease family